MRVVLMLAICTVLVVGTVAGADETEKAHWFDKIKFMGDLRLRYEKFDWDGKFDQGNRDRFRYRLRVGAEAQISDTVEVGFELRSGNPDNPHSDNQSFDGGFSKKEIAIAQARATFAVRDNIDITAGKFAPKKLWRVSDMQWDDDVVVEGVMEEFDWKPGGAVKSLELNLYQFALEESSGTGDSYLIGGQVAPTFELDDANTLTVGVGYDAISRPDKVAALTVGGTLSTEPEGVLTNLVDPVTGNLISDFQVVNGFVVWKNKSFEKWPLTLSLFYYQNTGAKNLVGDVFDFENSAVIASVNADDNDTAIFGRVEVGDYKKPGHVAFRYSRYDSEPDAMFYAFVQSDTKRGSNVDGNRLDIRVGLPKKSHVNVTWYNTDWKVGQDTTMDRLQVDYVLKF